MVNFGLQYDRPGYRGRNCGRRCTQGSDQSLFTRGLFDVYFARCGKEKKRGLRSHQSVSQSMRAHPPHIPEPSRRSIIGPSNIARSSTTVFLSKIPGALFLRWLSIHQDQQQENAFAPTLLDYLHPHHPLERSRTPTTNPLPNPTPTKPNPPSPSEKYNPLHPINLSVPTLPLPSQPHPQHNNKLVLHHLEIPYSLTQ